MWPAGESRIRARWLDVPLPPALSTVATTERVRVVEGGPAGGPPVVLVPGWGCSAYIFKATVPALAQAGFRVFVPDMRGHGLSDKPRDRRLYTRDALAGQLLAVMDALAVPRAAVVGHSMAGAVAAHTAGAAPARVTRLVLLSPVGCGRVRGIALFRAAARSPLGALAPHLVRRWMFDLVLRAVYAHDSEITRRDLDEYWAPTQFPDFIPALVTLVRTFDWSVLSEEAAAALTMPTLVAYGTRDLLLRYDCVPRALREGPGRRVVTFPGGGHVAHAEMAFEANRTLIDFLRGRAGVGNA
ncbi:MAG TPA: alpha/beta fold hydrolase [Gemmatimonadaceae bacterium]|nr:alpha/beta fold hydrolase [Gemmatimonadaceae bacterium]